MGNLFFETMDRLTPELRAGNLAKCEEEVVKALDTLPDSPFHLAAELDIRNDPADAAAHFDAFFVQEAARYEIAAAYTEMNGFDINPGRWYCDLFAYKSYGGHEDYDWLAYWDSGDFEDYTITGLERLQAVYAGPAFQNKEYRDASDLSSLLVVVKFQQFMQEASQVMQNLSCPLLVTAHDFEFIAEFRG